MNASQFAWLGFALPAAFLLVGASLAITRLLGWERMNYAGKRVATGYGIFFPALSIGLAQLGVARGEPWAREAIIVAAAVAGCGAFGLLDDLYGRASPKGVAGHFRLLLERREFTTGQLKAVGVACVGVVIGALVSGRLGASAVISGALVALCANGMNLLDVRPGRALLNAVLAFMWIGGACLVTWETSGALLVPIAVLALGCLVALPVDWGQHGMLGDVGAYALGAGIGSALALISPVWAQALAVALLIGLTMLADRYSLSALLERTRASDH